MSNQIRFSSKTDPIIHSKVTNLPQHLYISTHFWVVKHLETPLFPQHPGSNLGVGVFIISRRNGIDSFFEGIFEGIGRFKSYQDCYDLQRNK